MAVDYGLDLWPTAGIFRFQLSSIIVHTIAMNSNNTKTAMKYAVI